MLGLAGIRSRIRRLEAAAGAAALDRGPVVVTLVSLGPKPTRLSWAELLAFAKGVHPAATGNRAALAAAVCDFADQILGGEAESGPHEGMIRSAIDRVKDGEPAEAVLRGVLPGLVEAIDRELARGPEHAPPATSEWELQSWKTPPRSAGPPTT